MSLWRDKAVLNRRTEGQFGFAPSKEMVIEFSFFFLLLLHLLCSTNSSSKSLWQIDSCRKKNVMLLFGFFPTQLIASWIQTNGDTISRLSSLTLYHDHDNSDRTEFRESTEILPIFFWDSTEIIPRFCWESTENLLRIY